MSSKAKSRGGASTSGENSSAEIDLPIDQFEHSLFSKASLEPNRFGLGVAESHYKVFKFCRALALLAKDVLMKGMPDERDGLSEFYFDETIVNTIVTELRDFMADYSKKNWPTNFVEDYMLSLSKRISVKMEDYEEQTNMSANMIQVEQADYESLKKQMVELRSAVSGSMTAIMMVDRDLNITYANESTVKLLSKNKDVLRSIYPGLDPEKLEGQCIDQFHKNPAHQRKILSDPNNFPYQTDITVGPLTFQLNITSMLDDSGAYIGNTLEWSDVTDLRHKENEVVRLQASVENSMTPVMMIDRELVITYANSATSKLLQKHEATLRQLYPGFTASAAVGTCIDIFHKNPSHQRNLLANPSNLPYSTDIQVGPLVFNINVCALYDNAGEYIGNSLEWADVTEQRAQELEVTRMKSAVDSSTSALMLCDEELNITYVNSSVVELLRRRVSELRQVFPKLDPDNLVGQNIDQFHKNPAHQRALLSDPSRLPAKAEIKLLDLSFEVNATAITDSTGKYMGNMVEWKDITEQKDAESQVRELIIAASQGDLNKRIDASRYEGFMKGLSESVNNLIESMVKPLREGISVIQALSEGNLTESVVNEYEGEFGVLKDAINSSMTNLNDMVVKIREASENIQSSSSEIAQGNSDLSQRTEEQASSLEETASSMEQLTGTVKQNADNARQANQLAASARQQAEKGGEVVGTAVSAMNEINSSSKKIADIIGVIDEIAFQTNLLALNAAVEAARAGEQGRGFAVVASEVRSLAQRSASAAKEIKALIKDSVEKVEEGSRLVNESGETLDEIVNSVKKVSDIIAEIAAASQEQSSGIEQVNKAVMSMDEVTQQNAALVEEAAAASESMDEQAKGMMQMMEYFNVGAEGRSSSAPAQRPAQPAARPQTQARSAPRPAAPRRASKPDGDDWEEF